MTLSARTALITGGTSGIGAAVAERFVRAGMQVMITGRREDAGRAVAARLGDAATFVRADVGVDSEAEALVDRTLQRFGRIDVLVNNAGLPGQIVGLRDLDLARFDRLFAVNLRAPLVLTRAAAPGMIARGSGSVINVASVSGHRAGYSGHDYSTAKAALLHLTRSLAVELAADGVRVNSISPGPIATGIQAKGANAALDPVGVDAGPEDAAGAPPPFAAMLADNQPMPRVGVPADVAEVALFLASDGSTFVTGQDLVVDGGLSAGRPWRVFTRDWQTMAEAVRQTGRASTG